MSGSLSLSLVLPIILDPSNDVLGPLNGLNPPLADDTFLQVSLPSFDVFSSGFFEICHLIGMHPLHIRWGECDSMKFVLTTHETFLVEMPDSFSFSMRPSNVDALAFRGVWTEEVLDQEMALVTIERVREKIKRGIAKGIIDENTRYSTARILKGVRITVTGHRKSVLMGLIQELVVQAKTFGLEDWLYQLVETVEVKKVE
ncbi:MAG: hypothetical protein M0T81_04185 [Thermoplasmatales archaeon]|nr:hypothetical protein [Thermoplasmatales archaeon]